MIITLLFHLAVSKFAFSQIISEVVGQAGGQAVTSREVEADVVFTTLYQKVDKPNYSLPLKGKGLQSATSNLLMEILIVLEAESFKLATITELEINRSINTFQSHLTKSTLQSRWKNLELTRKELQDLASRKLRAMKFLAMKKATFLTTPSEEELRELYEKRKAHLQNKAFIDVKANLEKELQQDKLDQALREWFQVLRSKYEIRNLLIES